MCPLDPLPFSRSLLADQEEVARAQQRINALETELSMHADAMVQVAVLRKKIASSKERAQDLVNMIDKRITYLCKLWDEYLAKQEDNEIIELARIAVNDPVKIGINKEEDPKFFERVNILKDKVAELMLLDEQAAEAHKRATEDKKTLDLATSRLKEVEERHKTLLACKDKKTNAASSGANSPKARLQRAVTALEQRISSDSVNAEEKKDSEILLKSLQDFVASLPKKVRANWDCSFTTHASVSASNMQTSQRSSTVGGPIPTSSLISGTTVPTDESTSFFTTSSVSSTFGRNILQEIRRAKEKTKQNNTSIAGTSKSNSTIKSGSGSTGI